MRATQVRNMREIDRRTFVKFGSAGRWQLGDELTFGFYHWAKAQKNLRAILAGHLHFDFSERFSPTAVQHVVGANCNGCAAEIEFA